jgi:lipopolysaccharide export system protein LptA
VLAVVAAGVIGAVAYTMRPRESVAPPPKVERTDPTAVIEVQGGDAVQLKGKDQDLRVEYRLQTTNKDGETVLRDAKIMVNNRGGRNYVVTGKEAFIGKQNSSFDVRGDVRMETDDGLIAASQQATYQETEKMVRIPGAVRFTQGRMTGSGIGFTFDEQRDVMWILDQADVRFAAEKDQAPMAFTAGTFGFARRDRYMRFEKTMHMERAGQVIDADTAMVRLFPDRDEPDYVELRNGAKVTDSGGASALKSMSARDINLDYLDDGRTLQHATLAGNGEMVVASRGSTSTQKLAGDFTDVGMQPDGSVRSLSTRGRVVVTVPASKDTPPRTIRSNALVAEGNPQGLHRMTFSEGVEFLEPDPKGQAGRTVRARTLEAELDPAAGTMEVAHFVGTVDFTDGTLHAVSAAARYVLDSRALALSGVGPVPHVESDAVTIDAVTIEVTLNPRKMIAKGNVRSTLLPPKKPAAGAPETRRPALLGDEEPVSVISNAFTYDEASRTAEYAGQTRLLQGATTINANTLTLDEANGDLIATGKVLTNLVITGKQADSAIKPAEAKSADPAATPAEPGTIPADPAKPKSTIARAESFTYSDKTRKAIYETSAQLDGEQGNLTAGRLDLQLAKGENTLEALEAVGAVTAIVDKRTVTGVRLNYTTADEKYVVFGAPVRMIDADCQETIGKTLTFWKASDRVIFDGNNEVRTQTKGGGKCPTTPR